MSAAPPRRSVRPSFAFSLVETAVALALVSTVLLTGLTLLTLQPRLQDRARAGEEALRAIEAAIETVRAAELPLESGRLLPGLAYPEVDPGRNLSVTLEVTPAGPPDLYELTFEATYLTWGRPGARSVTTLAWRPR